MGRITDTSRACHDLIERGASKLLKQGAGGKLSELGLTPADVRAMTRGMHAGAAPKVPEAQRPNGGRISPRTYRRYLPLMRRRLKSDAQWAFGDLKMVALLLDLPVAGSKAFMYHAFGSLNPSREAVSAAILKGSKGAAS